MANLGLPHRSLWLVHMAPHGCFVSSDCMPCVTNCVVGCACLAMWRPMGPPHGLPLHPMDATWQSTIGPTQHWKCQIHMTHGSLSCCHVSMLTSSCHVAPPFAYLTKTLDRDIFLIRRRFEVVQIALKISCWALRNGVIFINIRYCQILRVLVSSWIS